MLGADSDPSAQTQGAVADTWRTITVARTPLAKGREVGRGSSRHEEPPNPGRLKFCPATVNMSAEFPTTTTGGAATGKPRSLRSNGNSVQPTVIFWVGKTRVSRQLPGWTESAALSMDQMHKSA